MKKHKIILLFAVCILCFSLTGCTIGTFSFFEFYEDETGSHFSLVGQHGAMRDGKFIDEEESSDIKNEKESEVVEIEEDDNPITDQKIEDSGDIKGVSLKIGWLSSDSSIIKGKKVSVSGNCDIFSIQLKEEKEVTIQYNIKVKKGNYQIIMILPDGTKEILQDEPDVKNEEKLILSKGNNHIYIMGDAVIFDRINVSVLGLEPEDFE